MIRQSCFGGLITAILLGGGIVYAQNQSSDCPQSGGTLAKAQALVKALEDQVEEQRTQLATAEANLKQAKNLLTSLEQQISTERHQTLHDQEQRLASQLEAAKRVVTNSKDPIISHLNRELGRVHEEIRRLEGLPVK